jgi:medium-chain acyl-[acyl-carrier-protein] hydrolase
MVVRLVCLPPAGGTAAAYQEWQGRSSPRLEVVPIELPGRGTKTSEQPRTDLVDLATGLTAEIRHLANGGAIALLGHSMGALVAFELAHLLQTENIPVIHLFVLASSSPAAAAERSEGTLAELPDDALLAALEDHAALPDRLRKNSALLAATLPWLRADLQACETYYPVPDRQRLGCPITAVTGRYDHMISSDQMAGWRDCTDAEYKQVTVPAGHDLLAEAGVFVWRCVENALVAV